MPSVTLNVEARSRLAGEFRPPSDKSLTHRAYLFAAMARAGSVSVVREPLRGEDCEGTLAIVKSLGAHVVQNDDGSVQVSSDRPWQQPAADLDCGNSGTTIRLVAGLLSGLEGIETRLVGDASLSRRPMGRIAEPLRLMGARIQGETPPLTIHGRRLHGIRYASPVASAQIKSCLLIAGVSAGGETYVTEPAKSRDHTERMFTALGVNLTHEDGLTVGLAGGQEWGGFGMTVPGDISSAAFAMVGAAVLPGSEILLRGVGVNPTRSGILDVFRQAGIIARLEGGREELGEPVADIRVSSPEKLDAFEISGALVPRLIDETPVLAVLATQCHGTTEVRDSGELRVKESDRIVSVANGLQAMGVKMDVLPDGFRITGPQALHGAEIEAGGDHRIAMAFAIAGLIASGTTRVGGAESIATSYPGFEADLEQLAQS